MTAALSKLPSENRMLRLDPDLAKAWDCILAPYDGKALADAQEGLMLERARRASGTWRQMLARYCIAGMTASLSGKALEVATAAAEAVDPKAVGERTTSLAAFVAHYRGVIEKAAKPKRSE